MKSALALLMVFTVTASANDDVYVKPEIGIVGYSPMGNNQWYQDGHANRKNFTGRTVGLGVGKDLDQWGILVAARYMGGGFINAEYEHDDTYAFLVENADHSVTGVGNSEWSYQGFTAEGSFRPTQWFRLMAGLGYFKSTWITKHIECDKPGVLQEFRVDSHELTPVVGVEFSYKRASLSIARYTNLYAQDTGVSAATTLTAGIRF